MGVFIVAELSANHKQDLSLAKESVYAIKECKANAIKLQTYVPESLTLDCKSEVFKIKSNTPWDNRYLYDLYKEAYMPLEWNIELFELAKKIDLVCFSSAFDRQGVDLLESLNNPIYKIASFEITDIPLIDYIASKKKPIILSSGVAIDNELFEAIETIRKYGDIDITLLECVSSYPAKLSDTNFAKMIINAQKYNVKYGLSDHSIGVNAAIMATSLKASVIEKHFILDKNLGGVDSKFSMDRSEFGKFVEMIRESEQALQSDKYTISSYLQDSSQTNTPSNALSTNMSNTPTSGLPVGREFARSLFVCKSIKKGERISLENIRSIRPNAGISPKYLSEILGKKATKNLEFGKPLMWQDFD